MKVFGLNLNLPDLKVLKNREEARFFLIGCAVVLITFLLGVIPSGTGWFQTLSELGRIKSQTRAAVEKIRNLPQLHKTRENYLIQISEYEKKLFDEDEISGLIGVISEMAKESELTIRSSKQRDYKGDDLIKKNPFYRPFLLELKLAGGYHNLGQFVNRLERYKKLILVDEMNVLPSEEKDKALDIVLTILTYQK